MLRKRYCSAYGKSSASIVTDVQGHNYVLLQYMEGHGTNASTKYLSIYELTDRLIERKRITLSEGAGMMARWTYQYAVATPSAGGILLTLTLTIDGTPDPEFVVPKKMKTVTVGSAH